MYPLPSRRRNDNVLHVFFYSVQPPVWRGGGCGGGGGGGVGGSYAPGPASSSFDFTCVIPGRLFSPCLGRAGRCPPFRGVLFGHTSVSARARTREHPSPPPPSPHPSWIAQRMRVIIVVQTKGRAPELYTPVVAKGRTGRESKNDRVRSQTANSGRSCVAGTSPGIFKLF